VIAEAIRPQQDASLGSELIAVFQEKLDDLHELRMRSRFSSQHINASPLDSVRLAIVQELAHLLHRHSIVAGILFARAVAIVTLKITTVGNI
jgi:hypothetical protein